MSEPWNQQSFEEFLNDDSSPVDTESWLNAAIDWDMQYPPQPQEPIQEHKDTTHLAEKQR